MTPTELRERREAFGLSQGQIAERLGLHLNTWHRWEHGTQPVQHPEILRLALDRLADELAPGRR